MNLAESVGAKCSSSDFQFANSDAGMTRIDGFFPLYWEERTGNLWLEIPRLDTPVLYTTGLAAGLGSNDIGLDRGQAEHVRAAAVFAGYDVNLFGLATLQIQATFHIPENQVGLTLAYFRIAALIAERDHWRDFASAEGLEVSHQTTRADAAEAEVTRLLAELETARAGTSDNVAQYIKNARDQASEFDRMESAFLAEEKHQRDDLAQRVATVRADATVSAVDACGLPADAIERLTRERDALTALATKTPPAEG